MRVGLDHLFAGRLEEQLRTAGTASLEVDHRFDASIGLVVLRDVQVAGILERLLAVVEEQHDRVVELASRVCRVSARRASRRIATPTPSSAPPGLGKVLSRWALRSRLFGLAVVRTIRNAYNEVRHGVVSLPDDVGHKVETVGTITICLNTSTWCGRANQPCQCCGSPRIDAAHPRANFRLRGAPWCRRFDSQCRRRGTASHRWRCPRKELVELADSLTLLAGTTPGTGGW